MAAKPTPKRLKLTLVTMPVASLRPAPYNARVALRKGDAEYEDIKRSILEYGLQEPLIYTTKRKYVLGGSQRLQVIKDMGFKDVEVVVVNFDSLKKEKAFSLALNKVGGKWSPEKLLEMVREGVFDDDELFTGFSTEEIDALTATDPPPPEDPDDEDPPEDPTALPTVYQIVVDCTDEDHQRQLKARFDRMGLESRAITV